MAFLSRKRVRRALVVTAIAIATVPFVSVTSHWMECQTIRARFDRIEVGATLNDVFQIMEPFHNPPYEHPSRLDWDAVPKDRPSVPFVFGVANTRVIVCVDRDGRVSYKQFDQKPVRVILGERWRAVFGSAPPF